VVHRGGLDFGFVAGVVGFAAGKGLAGPDGVSAGLAGLRSTDFAFEEDSGVGVATQTVCHVQPIAFLIAARPVFAVLLRSMWSQTRPLGR
jgi:hypothetical protein